MECDGRRERSVFYGNKPRRAKTPGVSTYKQTPIWMINAKDCSFDEDGESRIVGVTLIVAGDSATEGRNRWVQVTVTVVNEPLALARSDDSDGFFWLCCRLDSFHVRFWDWRLRLVVAGGWTTS